MTSTRKPHQLLIHASDKRRDVLASKLETADTLAARTKGLLGRKELPTGEGLWIKRCNSIHTFFMRFAIDAVFVDRDLKVVAVHRDLKPWRVTWPHLRATSVFELPSGTLSSSSNLNVGDSLSIEANGGEAHG